MCYFIKLRIHQINKKLYAIDSMKDIIRSYSDLIITGKFPNYTLTDNHCSCHFIDFKEKQESFGIANEVINVINDILLKKSIKALDLGVFWNEEESDIKIKLKLDDFLKNNKEKKLVENNWYHVYNPQKFYE